MNRTEGSNYVIPNCSRSHIIIVGLYEYPTNVSLGGDMCPFKVLCCKRASNVNKFVCLFLVCSVQTYYEQRNKEKNLSPNKTLVQNIGSI